MEEAIETIEKDDVKVVFACKRKVQNKNKKIKKRLTFFFFCRRQEWKEKKRRRKIGLA